MRYLKISDYSNNPPAQRYVIDGPNHHVVLDWTNIPIYRLNVDIPLKLTSQTICDYVRFFFSHVRGRNGRFIIVENVDEINWRENPPHGARQTINQMTKPLKVIGQDPDGTFNLAACVVFKDSLFECIVKIDPNGLISLSNEKLLIEDMPTIDDILNH